MTMGQRTLAAIDLILMGFDTFTPAEAEHAIWAIKHLTELASGDTMPTGDVSPTVSPSHAAGSGDDSANVQARPEHQ